MQRKLNTAVCQICGREIPLSPRLNVICAECCGEVRSGNAVIIKTGRRYKIVNNATYKLIRDRMTI